MSRLAIKSARTARRKTRVRHAIQAKSHRPRLSVHRTLKNIYAQIVDDVAGCTLASASSVDKDLRETVGKNGGNKTGATLVGQALAAKALAKGVKEVVFDRGPLRYHGRVQVLADAARKGGLVF